MVKKSNNNGYTLIELIITITIIAILSLGLPQLILTIQRFHMINNVQIALQQDARTIMERITKNLREAQNSTIIVNRYSNLEPHYSRINFVTLSGDNVTYYQMRKKLIEIVNNKTKILTDSLVCISFSLPKSYDLTIVSVAFTLEKHLHKLEYKALHMASEKVRIMN